MDALTKTYDLVVFGSEPPDVLDLSLDQQILKTDKEIANLAQEGDALERQIGTVLHQLSFRYPEIATKLRDALNTLRGLQGEPPVPREHDPMSMRDKEGKRADEELAKMKQEAEEAAEESIKDIPDDELPPSEREARFSARRKREMCKKLYLRIASKTHPDKVKDADLNPVFIMAKKAYEELDLDVLKLIHKDILDYLEMRKFKGRFRDFRNRRLRQKLAAKAQIETNIRKMKSGMAYDCVKAQLKHDPIVVREAYQDFIEEQCAMVDEAVRGLRQQMVMQRRTMSTTTYGSSPFTNW